jgi:ferric-dicitrate binding protein FerR (iron transport regulator)
MSEGQRSRQKIAAEARSWFKLLSNTSVNSNDIWAFAAWSRNRANMAAYDRVEARHLEKPIGPPYTEAELASALKRRPDLEAAYRAKFEKQGRPAQLGDIARELSARSAK